MEYDEDATHYMDALRMMHLLQNIEEPWGFGKEYKVFILPYCYMCVCTCLISVCVVMLFLCILCKYYNIILKKYTFPGQ